MSTSDIEIIGKVLVAVIGAVATPLTAFYTWKTRYELDRLYASKYRPNPDGTPGPMRQHPKVMVQMFSRKNRHVGDQK